MLIAQLKVCTIKILLDTDSTSDLTTSFTTLWVLKGTNPALKKSSNIPEIYAKMFGRFH